MKIYILTIYCLFLQGCSKGDETNEDLKLSNPQLTFTQSQETKKMILRLHSILENTNPMTTGFMNNERLQVIEEMVGNDINAINKSNIVGFLSLANENLKAGNSKIAANLFEKILAQVDVKNVKLQYTIRRLLALSYLRVGEQSNCIMLHGSESCIFPLSQSAMHINQQGSREAIKHLKILLNADTDNVTLKWLYTIAKQTIGEYSDSTQDNWLIPMIYFNSDIDMPAFKNKAITTMTNNIDLAGGSISEDFNGDGYIDILTSAWGTKSELKLYINNTNGSFDDKTYEAGLSGLLGGLNLVSGDYDNDGDIDVLVLRGAWRMENGRIPNSLLQNDGQGHFNDVTESANILSYHPTQTAAWGDFDNDGWLDLFIGNESFSGNNHRAELYHNNQDGTFENVATEAGVDTVGYIKGVTWGDIDNDGRIDLYISRMDRSNQLFKNESTKDSWSFKDITDSAGVKEPIYSFPTWFWDYNNDGWLDIFVADYDLESYLSRNNSRSQTNIIINHYMSNQSHSTTPRLYRNNTDGTFTDVTKQTMLKKPLLAMGANFGDIDNDGYLDMYIGTGDPDFSTLIPNRMFRNNNGEFFQDVTTTNVVGHLQKGHAISFADFDNDGDQDIYAVMGGAYSGDFFQNALFENPGHNNNWITLRLVGTKSNKSAIGARVEISIKNNGVDRKIYRVVSTGGSFGSNSIQLEIGLNKAKIIDAINIKWPSGINSHFENISVNQIVQITENLNNVLKVPLSKITLN